VIQQPNQLLHPCTLEFIVTDNPEETYNKLAATLGRMEPGCEGRRGVLYRRQPFRPAFGRGYIRGQGLEKICDRFALLTLENYVDQPPVMFGVSELTLVYDCHGSR
jgi:hypothetical protein